MAASDALMAARRSYRGGPVETARKNQAFGDGPQNYYRPPARPPKLPNGVYGGGSRPHALPTALPRQRRTLS